MTNKDTKIAIIEALLARPIWIKAVASQPEYRTRCPFCGDSVDKNKGHLYIRINPEDNLPIIYHCFKCEEKGKLTPDVLSLFDIDDLTLKSSLSEMNKTSSKYTPNGYLDSERQYKAFNYKVPNFIRGDKTSYIENRLGLSLSNDDLEDMKVITSLRDFLMANKIKQVTMDNYLCNLMEEDYVGFLSNGNSYILFRDITGKNKIRWLKYPVTRDSYGCRVFYTVSGGLDIFNKDCININLTEGIMDILSIKYGLNKFQDNSVNIAVTGKYYLNIIRHMMCLGMIGKRVRINLFSDNDNQFGNPNESTTLRAYKGVLKNIKSAVGECNVFYNTIGKDYGVPADEISLIKHRI